MTSYSDFVKPINYIKGNILTTQRTTGSTSSTIIFNNTFEVCSMLGEDAAPLLKFILPMISSFAPDFIHPCPYQGKKVGVENIPIDFSLLPLFQLSNFPKGDYQVVS